MTDSLSSSEPRFKGMLVGFLGEKGSGKSTAAEEAVRLGYISIAMADPLKVAAMAMFALGEEHCRPDAKEKPGPIGVSYREAMTGLGTDVMRDRGAEFWNLPHQPADHWVALARLRIVAALERGEKVVVPDLRFSNEISAVKALGGTVIWVHREKEMSPNGRSHESERAVHDCVERILYDAEIQNVPGKKDKFLEDVEVALLEMEMRASD